MSVLICEKCGFITSVELSDYWDDVQMKATRCYARLTDEGKWEKGCSYNKASAYSKAVALALIDNKPLSQCIEEV